MVRERCPESSSLIRRLRSRHPSPCNRGCSLPQAKPPRGLQNAYFYIRRNQDTLGQRGRQMQRLLARGPLLPQSRHKNPPQTPPLKGLSQVARQKRRITRSRRLRQSSRGSLGAVRSRARPRSPTIIACKRQDGRNTRREKPQPKLKHPSPCPSRATR